MKFPRLIVNTGWNLAGHAVPIIVALIAIPLLIKALNEAQFGILALGWLVTGYFALFDFGVSRATTAFMAIARQRAESHEHAAIFWTSLSLHVVLSVLGGGLFAVAVPWLVADAFSIPPELAEETRYAFWWLAFSVPSVVLSSVFRAALESEQRFDLVNAVKLPVSTLNYLAPILVVQFTQRVDFVIAVIAVTRWLALGAFVVFCFRSVTLAAGHASCERGIARRLLTDGGWLTVTNFALPLMMAIDRLLIARLCSLDAVTHYVVPYEVITKLWIFSGSLLSAMYPLMSIHRGPELRALSDRCLRWLLFAATPVAILATVLGRDLLTIWVGEQIAEYSAPVLQILAIGVWLNVLAQVPQTSLQASGHADIVGKMGLIELPVYTALAWWLTLRFGIVGAALAWSIRALVNALVLTILVRRTMPEFRGWPWRLPLGR